MPGVNTKLSNREKCAIFALVNGIIPDWETAYICADDNKTSTTETLKALACSVSRWKNSAKVKQYTQECAKLLATREAEAIAKGLDKAKQNGQDEQNTEESEAPKTQPTTAIAKSVDYSDPANQMRKLNDLVNTADDSGEALDALKVIIQTQKADKEAARERKTVVFFTPVKCLDCQMYQKAKARQEKG